MERPHDSTSPDALKPSADQLGGGVSVSDSIVAAWSEINAALMPIIGHQGVAALYKRSANLTARTHPWLGAAIDTGNGNGNDSGGNGGSSASNDNVVDLDALRSVFMRQDAVIASATAEEFLRNFFELLTNLIGTSLTERLLHSVWANFLSDSRKQDRKP